MNRRMRESRAEWAQSNEKQSKGQKQRVKCPPNRGFALVDFARSLVPRRFLVGAQTRLAGAAFSPCLDLAGLGMQAGIRP
jgi:hypothetical protein